MLIAHPEVQTLHARKPPPNKKVRGHEVRHTGGYDVDFSSVYFP